MKRGMLSKRREQPSVWQTMTPIIRLPQLKAHQSKSTRLWLPLVFVFSSLYEIRDRNHSSTSTWGGSNDCKYGDALSFVSRSCCPGNRRAGLDFSPRILLNEAYGTGPRSGLVRQTLSKRQSVPEGTGNRCFERLTRLTFTSFQVGVRGYQRL